MSESFLGFDIPDPSGYEAPVQLLDVSPSGDWSIQGGSGELPAPQPPAIPSPGVNGPSKAFGLDDIFTGVSATADSIMNAWGKVNQFQIARDSASLQRDIAKGQLAIQGAQANAAERVAVAQANRDATIAEIQGKSAVDVAQMKAAQAAGATVLTVPSDKFGMYVGIAGLALAAYQIFAKKKG